MRRGRHHRRTGPRAVAAMVLALGVLFAATGCAPPSPAPVVNRAPPPAPLRLGKQVVQVKSGDTVHAIARQNGVAVRDVIELNRLAAPFRLIPGQWLRLPPPRQHRVARGDTVWGIAQRYGVDRSEIVRLNKIRTPYTIFVGQNLRLPAGRVVASAAPKSTAATVVARTKPAPAGTAKKSNVQTAPLTPPKANQPAPKSIARAPASRAPMALPPRTGGKFQWPAQGKLLTRFGAQKSGLQNDGINIELAQNAPVVAAENGVVAYAGNELRGFGNLLLIRHADGWMSAYAHTSKLLVKRGDTVKRGQLVAQAGRSGSVTSPQLHFELRRGAQAVDPLKYL